MVSRAAINDHSEELASKEQLRLWDLGNHGALPVPYWVLSSAFCMCFRTVLLASVEGLVFSLI